jgi:nucleotide-binding universal stress UspA family protein
MGLISNILFPVDFSHSCAAMAPYVKRSAALFGGRVSLIHVFDPNSYTGTEVFVRGPVEIADEHRDIARKRLGVFLSEEFPAAEFPRIVTSGDVANTIAETASNGFDLIMMPTHAGAFRRTLLGSTTAKVLDAADCPVETSRHVENIAPRPTGHRIWVVAVGLRNDSERVLRFAHSMAAAAGAKLHIVHAIPAVDSKLPIRLGLEAEIQSAEIRQALDRIAELQKSAGSNLPVHIVTGPVKDALVEAARRVEADGLIIGRSPRLGLQGRLRDLTYAMVRDAPCPVVSV